MKIVFFVKDFHNSDVFSKTGMPVKSGAEFHAENQAQLLRSAGHTVSLMAKKRKWRDKARETIGGIDVVRLHAPFRWLELMLRLATTHRETDMLYILGQPWFAVWAIVWSKITGIPVFLTLTSESELFDRSRNWRTWLLANCDGYIANSKAMYKGLVERARIDRARIRLLPHGVDVRKYAPVSAAEKSVLREKYGFSTDQKIVLYCARVAINKGVDTLQRAWRIVHEQLPAAQLLIVGGGHYELLDQLRALGRETGNSVHVYGELPVVTDFYQLADVYIFPSRFEGLPTSLMEAVSSGLPCIASNIGGCEDLVFPDENGLLVEPESPEGFAKAMLALLNSPQRREAMSIVARRFAEEHLDSNGLTRQMVDFFVKVGQRCNE